MGSCLPSSSLYLSFSRTRKKECDEGGGGGGGGGTIFLRQHSVMQRVLALESEWLFHLSALKVSRWPHLSEPLVSHGKVGAVTPVSPD